VATLGEGIVAHVTVQMPLASTERLGKPGYYFMTKRPGPARNAAELAVSGAVNNRGRTRQDNHRQPGRRTQERSHSSSPRGHSCDV